MVLTVVKLAPSNRRTTKALLSNGQEVKVPVCGVFWGSVIEDTDVVKVGEDIPYHRSLVVVKEKKKPQYEVFRDLSGYDAKIETNIIRESIIMVYHDVFYGTLTQDLLEELTSDIVTYSWDKKWYQRWGPCFGGKYENYVKSGVYHRLQDLKRKENVHPELRASSLNMPVGDSKIEALDLLQDKHQDIVEDLCNRVLMEKLHAKVTALDKEGTGLPGFTYAGLFDVMVNGESLDDYLRTFKYERRLLDQYVLELQSELQDVYYEMAG